MFPGNSKKLEGYFPPKNRALASCPEDVSYLLTLRANSTMHLHQGEINREDPFLQGETQPGQRSRNGERAVVIARLDYIGFGMFVCGYFGNHSYIGRFSIKLRNLVLSLKIGLFYMATIDRSLSVTSPLFRQCSCFSIPYKIQIFLFSSSIWPSSTHLCSRLGSEDG